MLGDEEEWVMYRRVGSYVEYFTSRARIFQGDDFNGYTREILCRGTQDEMRKMWKFVTEANEER